MATTLAITEEKQKVDIKEEALLNQSHHKQGHTQLFHHKLNNLTLMVKYMCVISVNLVLTLYKDHYLLVIYCQRLT